MALANAGGATGTVVLQGPDVLPYIVEMRRRVHWKPDVIDNENMNKKKSKKCCIYRPPRAFDESSDESGSESDEDAYLQRKYEQYFAGNAAGDHSGTQPTPNKDSNDDRTTKQ